MGSRQLHEPTRPDSGRPEAPLQQQAFVQLVRAHTRVYTQLSALLRQYGISEPQFNVLRILRGKGPRGTPCHEIRERMITRVPDVTRLLDRLEQQGLVERVRDQRDRRVVRAALRPEAHRLLASLEEPVTDEHRRHFSRFSPQELRQLVQLLERAGAPG